jgi:hypothetical protein
MGIVFGNKRILMVALIAGLFGGLAEMGWIAAYSSVSATSTADVARGITSTVLSTASDAPWAPWAGVGIHLALSLALGLAFVAALWGLSAGRPSKGRVWASAIVALLAVWAVNFLVILPALNSSFAVMMPYGATLLSKTLFGAAMAWVLVRHAWGHAVSSVVNR